MSLTVNTNIASLNAQRNVQFTGNYLATSLQRLSSGLRVNSAKDDAAGMAVAQDFTARIRGNNQAIRNANDGISLGQTAEGALGQINNNVQRIREIAVQAANGSINDTNRSQLQKEVDQLTQEISRIVQTTQFNGTSLLSGGSTLNFQVGSEGSGSNQIQVVTTDMTATTGGGSAAEAAAAQSEVNAIAAYPASSYDALATGGYNGIFSTPGTTGATWVSGNVTATGGNVVLTSTDPTGAAAVSTYYAAQTVYQAGGGFNGGVTTAQLVAAAQAQANTYAPTNPTLNSYNSNLAGTNTISISSQANASAALAKLDSDISTISTTRSTFGAVQNRFEAVVANLSNYVENVSAARSRIIDADFASETVNLTRAQILQQAGTAILAQANSLPQTALSLLR